MDVYAFIIIKWKYRLRIWYSYLHLCLDIFSLHYFQVLPLFLVYPLSLFIVHSWQITPGLPGLRHLLEDYRIKMSKPWITEQIKKLSIIEMCEQLLPVLGRWVFEENVQINTKNTIFIIKKKIVCCYKCLEVFCLLLVFKWCLLTLAMLTH